MIFSYAARCLMFLTSDNEQKLFENFNKIGLKNEIKKKMFLSKSIYQQSTEKIIPEQILRL